MLGDISVQQTDRIFVALGIAGTLAEDLVTLSHGIQGMMRNPATNLHITLRFIGPASRTAAARLDRALGRISLAPLEIELSGAGSFSVQRGVRAMWVGVSAGQALLHLRELCDAAASDAGFAPDADEWRPHVTLGYLSESDGDVVATWTRCHASFRRAPFRVDRFGLYSSERSDRGSTHRLLRAYPLARPAASADSSL